MESTGHFSGIEQMVKSRPHLFSEEVRTRIADFARPYRELMAYYECAVMEVETKFRVLNRELSLEYDRNPIETVKSRLKSPESIADKLADRGMTMTVENIEAELADVAGVRVICSFPSDIYMMADAFLRQDDIRLLERKDYIAEPKENGYRSLHLIVEIPIFLHNEKRMMKVEIQFRTISMDWWASLEHKIRYKKDVEVPESIAQELRECAETAAALDRRMEQIGRTLQES